MPFESQNWDTGTFPATWTQVSMLETNAKAFSGSYSLHTTSPATVAFAFFNSSDTNGGNQRVRATFLLSSASSCDILLRYNGSSTFAGAAGYRVGLVTTGTTDNNGIFIYRDGAGGGFLGTHDLYLSAFDKTGATWYAIDVTITGTSTTTLVIDFQRMSDNKWLQSDGSTWGTSQPSGGCLTRTDTSSPITGASKAGVLLYGDAGSYVDDFLFDVPAGGASFTASPTPIPNNATTPVYAVGSSTTWSSGTTWSLSGSASTGASVSKTFVDATHYTLNITTGSATGTLTLSDGTLSFNVTVATGVLPNNSSIFWSPGSVAFDGSNFAPVNMHGTYFKSTFTGTSFTLLQDVSTFKANSISAANWGSWNVSIDDAIPTVVALSDPGASNLLSLSLASGLAGGTHTIYADRILGDETDTYTPKDVVLVRSLMIDGGSSFSSPTLRSKRAVVFGDSITAGFNATNVANTIQSYPPATFARLLGFGLNAESATVGFSGQGWSVTGGATNSHTFVQTWNNATSTVARTMTGFDYVIVCHGTNDGATNIQSAVVTWIGNARTACGGGTWIFLCAPFTNTVSAGTNLAAAVATYKAANPSDTKVAFIDPQTVLPMTDNPSGGNYFKYDSIHPTSIGHATEAAILTGLITAAVNTTTTIAGVSVSRAVGGY